MFLCTMLAIFGAAPSVIAFRPRTPNAAGTCEIATRNGHVDCTRKGELRHREAPRADLMQDQEIEAGDAAYQHAAVWRGNSVGDRRQRRRQHPSTAPFCASIAGCLEWRLAGGGNVRIEPAVAFEDAGGQQVEDGADLRRYEVAVRVDRKERRHEQAQEQARADHGRH
jgi:hypothetical protein